MNPRTLLDYIGNTPLIKTDHFLRYLGIDAEIYAKYEGMNPGGSIKDRAALSMLLFAEANGQINPDTTIIEATSGNTGIGLALICAQRGYPLILTMPESMSIERRNLLRAMGAQLVLTPKAAGMQGSVDEALRLAASRPSAYIVSQFSNPANSMAHYQTTAPEIWQELEGQIDILVASIGSGGTISGCGHFFKEHNPAVRIIGVEPAESPLISQGKAGSHIIQGIGANFIPKILDQSVIDEIITTSGDDALAMAQLFGKTEGYPVGISSGATLAAAIDLAQREENRHKRIVAILPDRGERYMSTPLFNFE